MQKIRAVQACPRKLTGMVPDKIGVDSFSSKCQIQTFFHDKIYDLQLGTAKPRLKWDCKHTNCFKWIVRRQSSAFPANRSDIQKEQPPAVTCRLEMWMVMGKGIWMVSTTKDGTFRVSPSVRVLFIVRPICNGQSITVTILAETHCWSLLSFCKVSRL